MNENEENEALAGLLQAARGHYDCAESFRLSREVVIALVRGLLIVHPDVTVAEIPPLAGKAGIPRSVLVRVGQGGPAAQPVRQKPTAWSKRTRLASNF